MLFKKEFDIDKDFFTEKPKQTSKRTLALRVFIGVLLFTFSILCYSAFTYSFNSFGNQTAQNDGEGLKEAQNYYHEAIDYYENGDFTKAIEFLKKQLAIVDDPDAYNCLAKIYKESGEIELAIENYIKALEYKPNDFEANFELGKIYYSLNDFKSAYKYLTKASNIRTDDIEVLSLTAETYKNTNNFDAAVVLLEKILNMEPDNIFANAKLGEIYFQKLEYRKAIPYLDNALRVEFNETLALELAKCQFELGELNSALDTANEVLENNKESKQAQSLKRTIEYKKGLSKEEAQKKEAKNPSMSETPLDKEVVTNYIKEIETPIKANWTPPLGSNLKKASVKFTVTKNGDVHSLRIYSSSGMPDFDKSALDAIEMSKPLPPLPKALDRENLDIIFTFDFNVKN